jgi:hypothetical protein
MYTLPSNNEGMACLGVQYRVSTMKRLDFSVQGVYNETS